MFVRGQEYKRTELHKEHGGQGQGGISTPKDQPYIFIFTGESGRQHGYNDYWEDGVFNYFGEGQLGPMQMKGGNRAIRDHQSSGKTVHLFRIVGKGFVRYEGEASYLGDHREPSQDSKGNARQAIVFELAVEPDAAIEREAPDLRSRRGPARSSMWKMDLDKLREIASDGPNPQDDPKTRTQKVRKRSESVKVYVRRRADGVCEGCNSPAPFRDRNGHPYLEAHHIYQRADEGPDDPDSVLALCPNCHRRVHSGEDGDQFNRELADQMMAGHERS